MCAQYRLSVIVLAARTKPKAFCSVKEKGLRKPEIIIGKFIVFEFLYIHVLTTTQQLCIDL